MSRNEDLLIPPAPPCNPFLHEGQHSVSIHPISLWPVDTIRSVFVFPSELAEDRFCTALKKAAGLWPTVAGRYARRARIGTDEASDFYIDLTSSPIPLSLRTRTVDQAFPTRDVIQPTIEPYLTPLAPDFFVPNKDCPLLSLQLTTLLPSRQSVLGVSWAHILGDAGACNLFIQILSSLYANDTVPTGLTPNFGPHIYMPKHPLDKDVADRYTLRQIIPTYSIPDSRKEFAAMSARSEPVRISFTRQQLKAMVDECKVNTGERLSTQDILSAWWVNVLERAGVEVDTMVYTISYRTLHRNSECFPPNLPTLAGNVAQMRAIPLPAGTGSFIKDNARIGRTVLIARSIRQTLDELRRDPQQSIEWLSAIAQWLEEAAVHGRAQVVRAYENEVLVNSNLRFNWNISFGFPWDETAFHTSFSSLHVLRVYEANPLKGQMEGETNVELVFNVLKDGSTKERVEEIILAEMQRWDGS